MKRIISLLIIGLLVATSVQAETCQRKAKVTMNQAAATRAAVSAPMTKEEYQQKLKALLKACKSKP